MSSELNVSTLAHDGHDKHATMKAVVWEGTVGNMCVKDVPKPKIQEPTDVLVKVTWAAICGTDLHTYHGILGGSDVPYIMGHEATGVIEEVGCEVKTYKVGERVVIPDISSDPTNKSLVVYGLGNLLNSADIGGCQAEYVRVPSADELLIRIPQTGNGHDLDYLLLSDIFATAWSSISGTGFQPGDTVAVYGCGPVGLLAAYSALLRGASKVYSIDHVASRLAKAKSTGAIPIDLSKGDPAEQILKYEPTGVNRVSDCVGYECVNVQLKPQQNFVINDAIKVCATNGGITVTGVYYSGAKHAGEPLQSPKFATIEWDVAAWWLKGLNIVAQTVLAGSQEPALQQLISAGRARPSFVIDHVVGIEDAPEAYRLFDEHKIQKAAIRF